MTYTVREDIARRWADATRHLRADEADDLWRQLMEEWLKPLIVDQNYWNDLLTRRMDALERKAQRSAVSDVEFDKFHGDINQ
jgi:hypothetical protein